MSFNSLQLKRCKCLSTKCLRDIVPCSKRHTPFQPPRLAYTVSSMPRAAKPIKTVAFVSLGCPKNLVDSERMLGLLAEDGLVLTNQAKDADAIVINTCGFLEASKTESMKEIHDAIQMKESGRCKRVVVAGCLVQRHKTKLLNDAPGIDRLVGVFDREHIVEAVRGKENPRQEHGHFLGKYHDLSRELVASGQLADGPLSVVSGQLSGVGRDTAATASSEL